MTDKDDVERLEPAEVRERTQDGALLVCAYDDEAKCEKLSLPGSIAFPAFAKRKESLSKAQEVVLYCA